MNDFITWWFEEHWFWSTIITAPLAFAWCCYKGLVLRGIMAFLLSGFITFRFVPSRRDKE